MQTCPKSTAGTIRLLVAAFFLQRPPPPILSPRQNHLSLMAPGVFLSPFSRAFFFSFHLFFFLLTAWGGNNHGASFQQTWHAGRCRLHNICTSSEFLGRRCGRCWGSTNRGDTATHSLHVGKRKKNLIYSVPQEVRLTVRVPNIYQINRLWGAGNPLTNSTFCQPPCQLSD